MARSLLSLLEDDELIDEIEEIDYDLLPLGDSVHKQQQQLLQQSLDHQTFVPTRPKSVPPHLDNFRIYLPPNKDNTNRYTNELFDATNNLIVQQRRITSTQNLQNLHDCKVIPPDQKFLGCVEWNQMEEVDFELDDVTRTRVFNNRFKRPIDEINPELNEYFRIHQNENKENLTKPFKVTKKTPALTRRKSLPLVETNNIQKRTLLPFKKPPTKVATRSIPEGVCQPRHQSLTPSKSCLSIEDAKVYLIESLTGLVNQATDFATELNGCTNEALPFPEHENEVVQIPTNSNDAQQMAIIRMFNFKLNNTRKGILTGFYSEKEFKDYLAKLKKQEASSATRDMGVEIVSQNTPSGGDNNNPSWKEKKVKWADNLEW